jgi:hypothetical protein
MYGMVMMHVVVTNGHDATAYLQAFTSVKRRFFAPWRHSQPRCEITKSSTSKANSCEINTSDFGIRHF